MAKKKNILLLRFANPAFHFSEGIGRFREKCCDFRFAPQRDARERERARELHSEGVGLLAALARRATGDTQLQHIGLLMPCHNLKRNSCECEHGFEPEVAGHEAATVLFLLIACVAFGLEQLCCRSGAVDTADLTVSHVHGNGTCEVAVGRHRKV